MNTRDLIVTTAPTVEGRRIVKHLGVVRGIVVRSPGFAKGLVGSLRSLFQGNISQFEEVCEAARQQANDRMVEHAQRLGAHAIVAMRYDATDFAQGVTEVLAYGTAVELTAP